MSKINRASGNDRVNVMIGKVGGSKSAKSKPAPPPANATTENVVSGNAEVGQQHDVWHGDLQL